MNTTDPPTMPNSTPNKPDTDEFGPYGGTVAGIDNIAKGVDPSPAQAEHEMPNPAAAGYDPGKAG